MNLTARTLMLSALIAACAGLTTGCGGGGDSASPTPAPTPSPAPAPTPTPPAPPPPTLSGTAATGAAIAGQVVAIDVNGKASPPATTNASTGAYTVDVTGLTAPYILTVTGSAGGRQVSLTSVATAPGQTVNLTPLTDLIVSSAAGVAGGSALVDACTPTAGTVSADCLNALKGATAGTKLKDAAQKVAAMIAPLNPAGTDPLNGSFKADGTGLDGVLDRLLVKPDATGTATVTLVSTQAVIGQVAAGGALTVTPPTKAQVDSADAVAKVLPEIRACMASLSALYPATGFQPPKADQVSPFIDDGFSAWGMDKASLVAFLASGQSPATGGFSLKSLGLTQFNLGLLSASEITVLVDPNVTGKVKTIMAGRPQGGSPVLLDANGAPASAWVRLETVGDVDGHQFVKGAPFAGCPGGWRWAGNKRPDMHMAARVARDEGTGEIRRVRAFHLERGAIADAVAAGLPDVDTVDIRGPGLVGYSGDPSAPVGASAKLTMVRSPNAFVNYFVVGGAAPAYYGDSEALLSCKDLAATSPKAPAGVPCLDESQVVPGSTYVWALKQVGTGKIVLAFPHEVGAVPLSKAFALANADQLFAKISSIEPASVTAVNTAIAAATGQTLDNLFRVNFSLGSAYGAVLNHCNLGLFDGTGAWLLRAEVNAVGQTSQCAFTTSQLNSGSLAKPTGTAAAGYVSVATQVLGNAVTTTRQLPK